VTRAYLNRLSVTVPQHDVHDTFVGFAERMLRDRRARLLFDRMTARSDIQHRWSCLAPARAGCNESIDADGFYKLGRFPSTAARISRYEREAPALAAQAVDRLNLGGTRRQITHLIVTSCTGLSAPGIDFEVIRRCDLNPSIERTIIGFMGCYAAVNALKVARHIVRSEPNAKVLVLSIELCTLHFQETDELEQMMPFLLFADGCAAALVSSEPKGLSIERFYATVFPEAASQMAWHIRDLGFDMVLSSRIPTSVGEAIRRTSDTILAELKPKDIELWAIHPGGRAILDAVEAAFRLPMTALNASRRTLRDFGNMSSATVLFVLKSLLEENKSGANGCAMSFGPGLTAETMLFKAV